MADNTGSGKWARMWARATTKASRRQLRSYQDSIRGASKKSVAGVPY